MTTTATRSDSSTTAKVAADGTNPGLGRDERLTYTSYAINPTLDRRSGVEVRQTDLAGNFVSRQRRYYDGADFVGLPLGQVMKGNLTRQEDNLGPAAAIAGCRASAIAYDLYGNRPAAWIPTARSGRTASRTDGHWTAATFDPIFHAYP